MKTYLITGGAGFIGTNFIYYLLRTKQDIHIVNLDALTYAGNPENLLQAGKDSRYAFVQGDITDGPLLSRLFQENDFDYVIHFAAESHVDRSILYPEAFVKTNVMGTVNLLNAAKHAWFEPGKGWASGKKYLQVSTDEVYGSLGPTGYFTESTPLAPHSPYSASKAAADHFVLAYADTYGMPVNITRCSNNYGPYQFPEKLIPLMICNAQAHKPLPVYGDGLQIRDWLYVEDHCKAIALVAERGEWGQVYNIGGHNERTNLQIVKAILQSLSRKLNDPEISEKLICHIADRQGHDRRYGIDPEKIHSQLGWAPETTFEEGIEKTICWYLEHRNWLERVTSGSYQQYYKEMYESRQVKQ